MISKINKFLFFFLILLVPELFSQNEGVTISGFVRDSTSGEALIGANILVYKDSINTKKPPFNGTTTNTYGFYAIPKLTIGNYIIIVRNIGYAPIVDRIKINSANKNIQVNFNAENLASGIYFYRIIANGFTAAKKMILTK